MAAADVSLHADGGPSTPDERVRLALSAPIIGQFDPAFTALMDDVMVLARAALCTTNERCFPISALPSAGIEAVFNTLLAAGDTVVVHGSTAFVAHVATIAAGDDLRTASTLDPDAAELTFGPEPSGSQTIDSSGTVQTPSADVRDQVQKQMQSDVANRESQPPARNRESKPPALAVVPHLDPFTGALADLNAVADYWHARGVPILVDATWTAGGVELRTDDWALDAVIAGVDYCLGAPSGLTLVTYSADLDHWMRQRTSPPPTSYLDLLQLSAYWSPERLNHHTAPTSLVYALREALRLLRAEGLSTSWSRHVQTSQLLAAGLDRLGLPHTGQSLIHIVDPPAPAATRARLREEFAISVGLASDSTWRIALLGADAQPSTARQLLAALATAR